MAKRIALHFPRLWKAFLYLLVTTNWGTGVAWFSLHRWYRVQGEFGEEFSPWEPRLLRIHGGSAMLMMIYFGYLLASHVPVGIRSRRNRILGITLLSVVGFLILTAYGLYYSWGEEFKEWVSWAHLIAGLSLPVVLFLHIWTGHTSGVEKAGKTRKASAKPFEGAIVLTKD